MAKGKATTKPKATAQKKAAPKLAAISATGHLYVKDLLATKGPRSHELMDSKGVKQTFVFENTFTALKVPTDMAIRLIENEGFAVSKTEDGEPLRPAGRETSKTHLSADETVAKFDELSNDALLRRCNANGASFKVGTTKNTMIAYLMGGDVVGGEEIEVNAEDDASDDEEDAKEETTADILNRLLGNDGVQVGAA